MALVARRGLSPPRPPCSPAAEGVPRPALRTSSPRSPPFRRPSNRRGTQRRGKLSVDRPAIYIPGVSRCAEHDARITFAASPRHGGVKRLKSEFLDFSRSIPHLHFFRICDTPLYELVRVFFSVVNRSGQNGYPVWQKLDNNPLQISIPGLGTHEIDS